MKKILLISLLLLTKLVCAQIRTIHTYVALCDNLNQGIIPVPKQLGNGKDPKNNLYWGAQFGVKTFFKNSKKDWTYVKSIPSTKPEVLDRILFKHKSKKVFLLAEAYDGEKIKTCNEDFLKSCNQQEIISLTIDSTVLTFGGGADLLCYVGHDGLMDFSLNLNYSTTLPQKKRDVIILACYSKTYYRQELIKAKASPTLLTTHLMAPEAYTLKAAIDGWISKESKEAIKERAAHAYNDYQKCGLKGARNLFTTKL